MTAPKYGEPTGFMLAQVSRLKFEHAKPSEISSEVIMQVVNDWTPSQTGVTLTTMALLVTRLIGDSPELWERWQQICAVVARVDEGGS